MVHFSVLFKVRSAFDICKIVKWFFVCLLFVVDHWYFPRSMHFIQAFILLELSFVNFHEVCVIWQNEAYGNSKTNVFYSCKVHYKSRKGYNIKQPKFRLYLEHNPSHVLWNTAKKCSLIFHFDSMLLFSLLWMKDARIGIFLHKINKIYDEVQIHEFQVHFLFGYYLIPNLNRF